MIPLFEKIISKTFNIPVKIINYSPLAGGCINQVFLLQTNERKFCIKLNDISLHPGMFEKESKGLKLLQKTSSIRIPDVINVGSFESYSYLLLEYIERAAPDKSFWEKFGNSLAKLHQNTSDQFGLDHDNYIGSLPQSNKQCHDWISFFINERLEVQIKLAKEKHLLEQKHITAFKQLYNELNNVFPKEPPALLHGDLWSGNFIIDEKGMPVLIDPAIYYGHREAEIAFTKLFGGFDQQFYIAYNDHFPLAPGFNKRVDIYNLYPLLVHLNLFGRSYLYQIETIVKDFLS